MCRALLSDPLKEHHNSARREKMSFLGYKSEVEFGDIATIYVGSKWVYVQKIEKGKVFQTKYGALRHDDLIGKQYGTKVHCKKGWIYLVHITPELWTQNLPHRTQILYATDISLITTMLYLKPGSVVIEAGTGSGSLSHSILRTIAPNGHLYTFDFHEERVEKASQEFKDHGLHEIVTISKRDVCKDGFNLCDIADAVFLDLPNPWEAISFAASSMKSKGSRICCFSPCIEQVQKTCAALREQHFEDIETVECVLKPFEMRRLPLTQFEFDKLPVNETDTMNTMNNVETVNTANIANAESLQNIEYTASNEDEQKEVKQGQHIEDRERLECKTNCKEYVAPLPMVHVAGHTGYLTFATNVF